ncbi:MAG: 30S ribosomal protein S16 [Armatimonadota bacterium]
MAVKIRLRRMGAKKRPFYRIVVADSRTARGGRFIDQLGYYNPTTEPPTMKLDEEKTKMWLGRGAQPTDTARGLLKKSGVIGAAQAEAPAAEETPAPEAAPKRRKKAAAKKEEA